MMQTDRRLTTSVNTHAPSPGGRLSSGKKALFASLFASLLATLLVLELAARLLVSLGAPPAFYSADFDKKYAIAENLSPAQNGAVLVMGTSRAQKAIYPELVESELTRLGCHVLVFNIAAYGASPADEEYLGKTALKSGFKPSMIIYDVGPEDVVYRAGTLGFSSAFAHSPMGAIVAHENNSVLDQIRSTLEENLYLVSHRQYFKSIISSLPQRLLKPQNAYSVGVGGATTDGSPKGWSPGYCLLSRSDCDAQIDEFVKLNPHALGNLDSPLLAYQKYLAPITALCRQRGIPLVFVWLPRPSHSVELCNRFLANFSIDSEKLLRNTAVGSNAQLIDLHSSDSDGDFSDISHLSTIGAIKTSRELAMKVSSVPLRNMLSEGSR